MISKTDNPAQKDVRPGRHFYQFYKNTDDYLSIMVNFFQKGLREGAACLWLASDKMGLDQIQAFAGLVIAKLSAYERSGQFRILSAQKWYLKNNAFDKAQTLSNAKKYWADTRRGGFKRLLIAGDASAIPRADRSQFYDYEKEADSVLSSIPVICLCAYPIFECTLADTKAVLECHPHGVLVSRVK